jgi:hypothetical protein
LEVLVKHCTALGSDKIRLSDSLSYAKAARASLAGELELAQTKLRDSEAALGKSTALLEEKDAALEEKDAALEKKDVALKDLEASVGLRVADGISAYKAKMDPAFHFNRVFAKKEVLDQIDRGTPSKDVRSKLIEEAEEYGLPREAAAAPSDDSVILEGPDQTSQVPREGATEKTADGSGLSSPPANSPKAP